MADLQNDLVVIVTAGGRQASRLIPYLTPKWHHIRLVCASSSSRARLQEQYPSADVQVADLANQADCARVLDGATAVWHNGPAGTAYETEMGYFMIDAALAESRKEGRKFKHFVYSSVLNTQLRKLMNHDCKRYVEEKLMESGLNYTIMQPAHFMDNIPMNLFKPDEESPTWSAPYSAETAFSFASLKDYGEATALVLEEREKHYFAQYPLVSTLPTKYTDVMEIVGGVIGKKVKIEKIPYERGVGGMLQMFSATGRVMDPRTQDAIERLVLYYNRRGLWGNPRIMEWLLGRKPTSIEQFAKDGVAAAKESS